MVYPAHKEPEQGYVRETHLWPCFRRFCCFHFAETELYSVVSSGLNVVTLPSSLSSGCWVYGCVLLHSAIQSFQ